MSRDDYLLSDKKSLLIHLLKKLEKVLVALSGGVDSSLLMVISHQVLKRKAVGIIAVSDSLHPDNLDMSRRVTKSIGAELIELKTPEVSDPDYQKNTPLRCYFCKHIVYSEFKKIAVARNAVLIDGFNIDDAGETRPGVRAAQEQGVRHPLFEAGMTKKDIRRLAQSYHLPNWNKSADACLSSRILTGVELNPNLLKTVAELETQIRWMLELSIENSLRLRYLGGGKTRIELDKSLLPLPVSQQVQLTRSVKSYGFTNISIVPYQRGSVSAANIYR